MKHEFLQARFRETKIDDRPVNPYELKLKEAIEASDDRIRVHRIQVRNYYKQDFMYPACGSRRGNLLLIFSFYCPCGDLRYEMFNLYTDWKQPQQLENWCRFLKENTAKHLTAEGLL